jgi:hypothetical protein
MNNRRAVCSLFVAFLAAFAASSVARAEEPPQAEPVIQTGVPHATQDKPQSKLWFAHGRWWAWLPVGGGSAVFERTDSGWKELESLRHTLQGWPGQADIWSEGDLVRAVLVGKKRLAVAELRYDAERRTYVAGTPMRELTFPAELPGDVETATLCRDARGTWWVACDRGASVCVFQTRDVAGLDWGPASPLASGIGNDDICAIFAMPDRVGVLWSDQQADAVLFREQLNGSPADRWEEPVTVERGGRTADDHINGVLAEDGTLYVATKNSVDAIGAPQQVLRVRRPNGVWENHPYAVLQEKLAPSRPIALLGGTPPRLYLLHTQYDRRGGGERRDFIAGISTDLQPLSLTAPEHRILSAAKPINNVTGCKGRLPAGAPWIVLASDARGDVYEAVLTPFDNR